MGEPSPRRRAHARSQVRAYAVVTCVVVATSAILVASCSEPNRVVLGYDLDDSGSPPAFTDPIEAGSDVTATPPITYCPSNKCPGGHTSCPDSFFPCDVDLYTDRQNCGACGVECPAETFYELYTCVAGQCVMSCKGIYLDCDGVPDNGCETRGNTNPNCGACGVECLDPQQPCVLTTSTCGCPPGQTLCNLRCIPTQADDKNCGACGNKCPNEGPTDPPPNMYFGCLSSACGKLKCEPGWVNCDGDLLGTGCETESGTDTNCAGCGDNCLAKGQTCLRTPYPYLEPYCGCPEGQTFCGSCEPPTITVPVDGGADGGLTFSGPPICIGRCINLTNDVDNCGGCGLKCNGTCEFGACVKHCPYGRADCDGNPDCEVNSLSDPENCGGCGIVCDAIAGQACVGGRCVVEPCEQGDGGLTR